MYNFDFFIFFYLPALFICYFSILFRLTVSWFLNYFFLWLHFLSSTQNFPLFFHCFTTLLSFLHFVYNFEFFPFFFSTWYFPFFFLPTLSIFYFVILVSLQVSPVLRIFSAIHYSLSFSF